MAELAAEVIEGSKTHQWCGTRGDVCLKRSIMKASVTVQIVGGPATILGSLDGETWDIVPNTIGAPLIRATGIHTLGVNVSFLSAELHGPGRVLYQED